MPKGIRKADDPSRDPWDWSQNANRPILDTRYEVGRQINEWLAQWNRWFNTVLLLELDEAINGEDNGKPDPLKFKAAMERIQSAGTNMQKAGGQFLDKLNEVYKPSRDEEEPGGRPPRGDATKPPPPPFGGGH